MKKNIALTALALILLAPGLAHAQSTSAVSRTTTVVERAAQDQGFEAAGASSSYVVPSLSTMAPEMPADAAPVAPAAPSSRPGAVPYAGARPGLVNSDLPPGLVMNGPGTKDYKKKHSKKKKKAVTPEAPVEQAAPAESSSFAAPEPTPEAATPAPEPTPAPAPVAAPEPAPVAPAPEAAPPADIPGVPQETDPAAPAGNGDLGPGGIVPPAPLTP